jgi:hypothetical protein
MSKRPGRDKKSFSISDIKFHFYLGVKAKKIRQELEAAILLLEAETPESAASKFDYDKWTRISQSFDCEAKKSYAALSWFNYMHQKYCILSECDLSREVLLPEDVIKTNYVELQDNVSSLSQFSGQFNTLTEQVGKIKPWVKRLSGKQISNTAEFFSKGEITSSTSSSRDNAYLAKMVGVSQLLFFASRMSEFGKKLVGCPELETLKRMVESFLTVLNELVGYDIDRKEAESEIVKKILSYQEKLRLISDLFYSFKFIATLQKKIQHRLDLSGLYEQVFRKMINIKLNVDNSTLEESCRKFCIDLQIIENKYLGLQATNSQSQKYEDQGLGFSTLWGMAQAIKSNLKFSAPRSKGNSNAPTVKQVSFAQLGSAVTTFGGRNANEQRARSSSEGENQNQNQNHKQKQGMSLSFGSKPGSK